MYKHYIGTPYHCMILAQKAKFLVLCMQIKVSGVKALLDGVF